VKVWICIAYDPLPGLDSTTRLLRYGTLAEQLAAAGHSVVMWTSTFDHWRKTQRFMRHHAVAVNERLRIELLHAPGYARNVSFSRIQHNRKLAGAFRAWSAAAPPPDIIFAGIPCLELAEAAADYARTHGVPLIADVQDIWPEVYVSPLAPSLRWLGRTLLWLEFARARRIFRAATAVTAVSQRYLAWAQRLRGSSVERDAVFWLGYRLPPAEELAAARRQSAELVQRLGLPADRILALFLGQFAASYDVATMVAAAGLLESRGVPVHLVLAGNGHKFDAARKAAAGIRSITLPGWLDRQDVVALLQISHIGLAAYSRRAPQSLPYKPFEYMAFGLPIISSLEGELREFIKIHDVGIHYCAGDTASLADAVGQLTADPNRRNGASRHARLLFASRFDARIITGQLVKYLEALASSARQERNA